MQLKKKRIAEDSAEIKKILRRATEVDIQKMEENKSREKEALARSRAVAKQLKLVMKICEVDFQADGRKATFFYTAEDRVDFRELIKIYASEFKVKVEMKQIGARQESAKVGGIGSCGRELCCSSWLNEFKSVTTTMARYQNLSINQTKLSGQCGRLKCCLNYELDTYLDALQHFPDHVDVLYTTKGNAHLSKKDIFKNLMWYTLPDSNKQYPLTIETVKRIKAMNDSGQRPDELETAEVIVSPGKIKEVEPQFVDVVGQISLRSLERNAQKRKGAGNKPNKPGQPGRDRHADTNPQKQQPGPRQQLKEKNQDSKQTQAPKPGGNENRDKNRENRPQGNKGQTSAPRDKQRQNRGQQSEPRQKPTIESKKENPLN
jgi:cell fate regulator YaaT (PSP1 superfamily)